MAAFEEATKKPNDFDRARLIYTKGGNSNSYSVLTVPPLTSTIARGLSVEATGQDGEPVTGTVYIDAAQGNTQIAVLYDVSEVQTSHVRCRVGGLPAESQRVDGCIDINEKVTIGGNQILVRAGSFRLSMPSACPLPSASFL
jgi:hypothetical protein